MLRIYQVINETGAFDNMIPKQVQPHTITGQAEVLLPAAVSHGFDYAVPAGLVLAAGDVVRVPFGKGESIGVVLGGGTAQLPPGKVKPIAGRIENITSLSPALLEFIKWVAWYNCAPMGAVLKMVLPVSDPDKKIQDATRKKLLPVSYDGGRLAQLNKSQAEAAQRITESLNKGYSVTLLDGVTGSGKTEVYFQAIADILKQPSGQAVIMLPEIALSVQWLERFKKRFGFAPLIWHSGVTPAQKRASFAAIASGEGRVIVGARSALFLPYKDLQFLVVDEEHDASYKQEDGVMYHARDMAVARARFEQIPALLVSATPSLESYENAKQGRYNLLTLAHRHKQAKLPDIHIIDMREAKLPATDFISPSLRDVLTHTLEAGHQSLLFLNRRGYAPLMLCRTCGHRFECPDCSSWLVMHKKGGRLQCHHCDYKVPVPNVCPSCDDKDSLHPCGPGVERLQEELSTLLPEARVAVLASDQSTTPAQLKQTIADMSAGKIDILIGTQMVAKGHHFPQLATVGVVDADLGLAGGDLRAAERTYQLLHQISGRAGREDVAGNVYLQSYLPNHPVMQALLDGGRDSFFAAELEARQDAHMPPFARLAAVIIEGKKEDAVINMAKALAASLRTSPDSVDLFGPAPAPMFRLRDKYRYRLLVRSPRNINLPDYMQKCVASVPCPSSVRTKIDIDPVSFM